MSDIVESWQVSVESSNAILDPDTLATNVYNHVLQLFRDLAKGPAKDLGSPSFGRFRTQAQKFSLWGNDVDAAEGQLDKKLVGAEYLQSVILPILSSMGEKLIAITHLLAVDGQFKEQDQYLQQLKVQIQETIGRSRWKDDSKDAPTQEAITDHISLLSLDDQSSDGSERHEDEDSGQMEDLLKDITTNNECLFRLTSILDDLPDSPTIGPINTESEKFDQEILQSTAWPYIRIIMETYPSMNRNLARRLGEANKDRFTRLQAERMSNAAPIDEDSESPDEETGSFSGGESLGQGSSIVAESDITAPSTQITSLFDENRRGRSKGTMSITTFGSDIAAQDSGKRRGGIPRMPDDRPWGEPYPCTVCGKTLSEVWGPAQWVKHVYNDLQPYICSFSDCERGTKAFTSRREWSDHEFSEHREKGRWYCAKCKEDMLTEFKYDVHRSQIHSETTALQIGRANAPSWICREVCPFCQTKPASTRSKFISHVGRHMQEVSQAAIPMSAATDDSKGAEDEDFEEEEPEDPAADGYNEPAAAVQRQQGWDRIRPQDVADPFQSRMSRGDGGRVRSTAHLLKPFMG